MTPEKLQAIKDSWNKPEFPIKTVKERFHDELWGRDLSLADLLKDKVEPIEGDVIDILLELVGICDQPEKLKFRIDELKERNSDYGLTSDHIETIHQCINSAIKDFLDSTVYTIDAWTEITDFIKEIMANNFSLNESVTTDSEPPPTDIEQTTTDIESVTANAEQATTDIEKTGETPMSTEDLDNDSSLYQRVMTTINTAVMVIDRDLVVTYVNEGTKNLFEKNIESFSVAYPNFDPKNIVGTCIDVFHKKPEHQRGMLANPDNFPHKAEIRVGELCFSLNISALYDGEEYSGNILEWVDITAEKNAYADFSGQISAIGKAQAVIEFNMDGTIVTANDNFYNTLGYSLEEVQGQHHSMFVDNEYKSSVEYRQFWEKLNRGEYESGEYKRIARGGEEIWIQASYNPIIDANGKPFKVVEYATDVTAEKLSNANYSGQIEAISKSQAVIEFNMDGSIITANDNFLNAVGYSLEEIKGQHHSLFVDNEYKSSVEYRQFWEQLNRGEYDSAEYKRIAKGGKTIWIQASYNPIMDLNGKPFKVVKYATDVTGRKQAVAKIKEILLVMAEGDLTSSIEGDLEGEFSVLGEAINSLVDNLSGLATEIRSASTNVFSASREIAQGNNDLSQRTETQAANLEETASAMEELTTTVQQNAENASEATKMASGAMDQASNGGEVIKSAVSAMEDINKSSKKIADIIGVIDEIAFQTNLLALNAAVEAARAGEQGRGFAVVAAEVRNLAQRSAGAAKEIKGLISDSVEAVGKGTKLVDETGQTFGDLIEAVQQVVTMIADIDNASQEQSNGIAEISKAVNQMDEMTQQNAALVEEAAASSKSMETQAQSLIEQVSFFRTNDEPGVAEPKSAAASNIKSPLRAVSGSSKGDKWEEF